MGERFLIVDDHPLMRKALSSFLVSVHSDARVEELPSGVLVIEKLQANPYDLVIMDIQMPNTETLQLINYIHLNYPAVPLLIYSMAPENIYAVRVIKAGAKGFVHKGSGTDELRMAIESVLSGKSFVSQALLERFSKEEFSITVTPFAKLSPRELQIASLLLTGKTVLNICQLLDLKNSTVGTHKAKIFRKLNVNNLIELKELSNAYQF